MQTATQSEQAKSLSLIAKKERQVPKAHRRKTQARRQTGKRRDKQTSKENDK